MTLVARDAEGYVYSIVSGKNGITENDLLEAFSKGKTVAGGRAIALFRFKPEAEKAFPTLNKPLEPIKRLVNLTDGPGVKCRKGHMHDSIVAAGACNNND